MKVIYNTILPPKSFKCINLFGVLFARRGTTLSDITLNHEAIHTAQMKEMGYIFFYIWYVIEWLVRLCYYQSGYTAYLNISFEREAYDKEEDLTYLDNRAWFQWLNYIKEGGEE